MAGAAYFRDWRASHPAYRTRQTALRAERRRRLGREDRSAEYTMARSRRHATTPTEPMPALHQGHPLFDQARSIVGPNRSGLTVWLDPLYDDLISVATLALVRGEDARAAVSRFRSSETAWRRMTCPVLTEIAA
jgi:hypothetical protein